LGAIDVQKSEFEDGQMNKQEEGSSLFSANAFGEEDASL